MKKHCITQPAWFPRLLRFFRVAWKPAISVPSLRHLFVKFILCNVLVICVVKLSFICCHLMLSIYLNCLNVCNVVTKFFVFVFECSPKYHRGKWTMIREKSKLHNKSYDCLYMTLDNKD